jgi:hypothetical protein
MDSKDLIGKIEKIKKLAEECLQDLGSSQEKARRGGTVAVEVKDELATDIILQIVNKIGDCDETEAIHKEILDKRGAEGRILLPFYVSHKYFGNEWLTSGGIEKITSDLGVKISTTNVSNYLTTFRKYLESGAARKKGQPTPYRLNRNGVKRFEEIINAKES